MPAILGVVLLAVLAPTAAAARTVWYVDDNAPGDPGPGDPALSDPLEDGSEAHPFDAIQEGINAAAVGDEVVVANGLYTGVGNKDLDFGGKDFTVRSASGDPAMCIIDCEQSFMGFSFQSAETAAATVSGLTIRNGLITNYCRSSSPTFNRCVVEGGNTTDSRNGVYCSTNSNPRFNDCVIRDHIAYLGGGGGVCCRSGSAPIFTRCIIQGNTHRNPSSPYGGGGGVYCGESSNPVFESCTISDNRAETNGGGIFCDTGSHPTIHDCVFSGNYAGYGGGAVFTRESSSPTFSNCSFEGNSTGSQGGGGAALCYFDSYPQFNNCRISGNRAYWGGGIRCCYGADVTLRNCTIYGNYADIGGGLYCLDSTPTLSNCILWNNGPESVFVEYGNPVVTYCAVQDGWPGMGNLSVDPLFVRLPSDGGDGWGDDPNTPDVDEGANDDFGDMRLSAGSPCIDAGSNAAVPADTFDLDGDTAEPLPIDLGGDPRFVDDLGMPDSGDVGQTGLPVVDIGAYEFQGRTCFGDFDGDGLVNLVDLALLLGHYGQTGVTYREGDLDADGDVDLGDLAELLGRYGDVCP